MQLIGLKVRIKKNNDNNKGMKKGMFLNIYDYF